MKMLKTPQKFSSQVLTGLLGLLFSACATHHARNVEAPFAWPPVPELSEVSDAHPGQAFTCTYEKDRIPPRDADADKLFWHAHRRFIQNVEQKEEEPAAYAEIERLFRISAAWGHDKAAYLLAAILLWGRSEADDSNTQPMEIAKELVHRGIPRGYLLVGHLKTKDLGWEEGFDIALLYCRKAAELGDPEAQFALGMASQNAYTDTFSEEGKEMLRCAAKQGHSTAATLLASTLKREKKYDEALKYLQLAVKAGGAGGEYAADAAAAARALHEAFLSPEPEEASYLGLPRDEERARRYLKLSEIFDNPQYARPTAYEINRIVPLPPVKLPPWSGKETPWTPSLPSKERIQEMARAKGLSPETGLPVKRGGE